MELAPKAALSSDAMNATALRPVGDLLREWRQRRRLSQLDFAVEAEISSKHLSFLETGRSRPSREMLLKLAELLEVPLRERNTLLASQRGSRPCSPNASWTIRHCRPRGMRWKWCSRVTSPIRAIAVDRHWTLLARQSRHRADVDRHQNRVAGAADECARARAYTRRTGAPHRQSRPVARPTSSRACAGKLKYLLTPVLIG